MHDVACEYVCALRMRRNNQHESPKWHVLLSDQFLANLFFCVYSCSLWGVIFNNVAGFIWVMEFNNFIFKAWKSWNLSVSHGKLWKSNIPCYNKNSKDQKSKPVLIPLKNKHQQAFYVSKCGKIPWNRLTWQHWENWLIFLPFYIPQLVKSLLFHIPEAWKGTPFGQTLHV